MIFHTIFFLLSCTEQGNSLGTINTPLPTSKKENTKAPLLPVSPLKGKALKEICGSYFLSLTKWRYEELQSNFRNLCCTPETLDNDFPCGLDWPFSDVPSCSAYDQLRSGILAVHGYPFKGDIWKEYFGKEEWYQRREDYSESWLSAAALENISTLMHLKNTKVHCTN
jgi:hypothetical protein